jgi:hypothetical protein
MASYHVHELETSPSNARSRFPHLAHDKTRNQKVRKPYTKKCATVATRAHVRASHRDGGDSTQSAQPDYNDLTAWWLNQGRFGFP